jgi:hypothetical protein
LNGHWRHILLADAKSKEKDAWYPFLLWKDTSGNHWSFAFFCLTLIDVNWSVRPVVLGLIILVIHVLDNRCLRHSAGEMVPPCKLSGMQQQQVAGVGRDLEAAVCGPNTMTKHGTIDVLVFRLQLSQGS